MRLQIGHKALHDGDLAVQDAATSFETFRYLQALLICVELKIR